MLDRVETLLDKGVTASEFLQEIDRLPLNTQAIADALYTITAVCLGTEQPRSELKAATSGQDSLPFKKNDDAGLRVALDSLLATGKKLVLIQGAPGAGKSTLARKLCEWYGSQHFEADRYFERNGKYKFDKSRIGQAHDWCRKRTDAHFKNSSAPCTIVSNTFAKPDYFKPYFDIAEGRENCIIVRLLTQHDNIHGAPDYVVQKMRAAIAGDTTPADIVISA